MNQAHTITAAADLVAVKATIASAKAAVINTR